jgi:hypothetical protein
MILINTSASVLQHRSSSFDHAQQTAHHGDARRLRPHTAHHGDLQTEHHRDRTPSRPLLGYLERQRSVVKLRTSTLSRHGEDSRPRCFTRAHQPCHGMGKIPDRDASREHINLVTAWGNRDRTPSRPLLGYLERQRSGIRRRRSNNVNKCQRVLSNSTGTPVTMPA